MKNECDIVKDLIPNYSEDLLSENTNQFIKEHLISCQECRKLYEGMKKVNHNKEDDEQIEINHLKKYSRHMLILKVMLVILALIIVTLPLFFIIRYNRNSSITNKVVKNVEEYKNSNNYCLERTEHQIDYERNTEYLYKTKYFYKDGQYKIQDFDNNTFSYGKIESNEKIKIDENLKTVYNIKSNYIFEKKGKFLNTIMIELQPFSKDYGTLPDIWFRTGYTLRTDKYNGRKCYVLKIGNKSSYREIWIDKEKNILIRTIEECYNRYYREKVYSINFDVVTNEDVSLPDITEYTIKNSESNVPDEYINIYEQFGI